MQTFCSRAGNSWPLGATPDEQGVNFALFSEHAEAVELCLFDSYGQQEVQRLALKKGEDHCWSVFVLGLKAGAKYGYRVYGPYLPEKGLRFNANKLLIDPYARELDRDFCWDKNVFPYDSKNLQKDLSLNDGDSAAIVPKSVVCERASSEDIAAIQAKKPGLSWAELVIYECHVRGFSQLKLELPADIRGTFAGLAHPNSINYLRSLGVSAVELLPVHSFIDEEFLVQQGLSNYWGYNTLNFFCVHRDYLSSGKREEFKQAVAALHEAGIEVILDVVYNHTAESNQFGPLLSFRGIDNLNYYRLEKSSARYYVNDTGCGNTVRVEHPRVMQLVLDSLRYWAGEMGVDGFRFDLASILGRDEKGFSNRAAFFQAVAQDPLLASCKFIAEPWDIGPGGYQLGAFPGQWSEWNDKYRDICRRFWTNENGVLPEFARRIHGSADLFEYSGRKPRASLNFICSHDGFSLRDLVSYRERNNIANKENNRDGHHANFSDNYGVEGPSQDANIDAVRWRQQRNFIATLMFSQGTPMMLGGDEFGRTQQGNNNAYCQDNEINWFNWPEHDEQAEALKAFTAHCIELRKAFALFTSEHYIHEPNTFSAEGRCSRWVNASGAAMSDDDWHHSNQNQLGWILQSAADAGVHSADEQAGPVASKPGEASDKTTTSEETAASEQNTSQKSGCMLMLLFNASDQDLQFHMPDEAGVKNWQCLLDSASSDGKAVVEKIESGASSFMCARSLQLLKAVFIESDSSE
ncbi:glycogen debranching protein GlgX [Agaribacterium haliotis]|uniref:glycogen debranching protein GlgX n=1 Tax=Agaribacterium haliotis TaxID=2013869 RepID=UPI000BB53D07|nr:glycogen debranching protein GlgX [Agaribacterium haliotis]